MIPQIAGQRIISKADDMMSCPRIAIPSVGGACPGALSLVARPMACVAPYRPPAGWIGLPGDR